MKISHIPNNSGVYKIVNGDKLYIGYAKKIRARLRNHLYELNNNLKNNQMQIDWNIDNSNFISEVIEITDDKNREVFWILEFSSHINGYNIDIGKKMGDSHKELMSKVQTGENNSMFGKNHSINSKRLISLNNSRFWKNKKFSKEHIQRLSESHKNPEKSLIDRRTNTRSRNRILKTIKYYEDRGFKVPDFQLNLLKNLED